MYVGLLCVAIVAPLPFSSLIRAGHSVLVSHSYLFNGVIFVYCTLVYFMHVWHINATVRTTMLGLFRIVSFCV